MGCKVRKEVWWTLLVVVLIAAVVIPVVIVYTTSVDTGNRIACYPLLERNDTLNSSLCESKGCVWDGIAENVKCHLPFDGSRSYGYEVAGELVQKPSGFRIPLRRRRLNAEGKTPPSLYGGDWDQIEFEVIYYNDQTMRFVFYRNESTYEAHQPPVPLNLPAPIAPSDTTDYVVQLASEKVGDPFDFTIKRRSNNVALFDTSLGGLTLSEKFHMITTALPSKYLYGIGENTHDSFVHNLNYKMHPIWARDQPPGDGEMNLYGSHPFYMVSEEDGSSHGVFFYNSHAIDVTTLPYPGLTYRTIGGTLDFFVFLGPEPEHVVQQYTAIIGRTVMPAYWSLGFQLCRYGYSGTEEIRATVERTRLAGIPQDVQYADIDYMDNQADFTLNMSNFGDLPAFVDEQQAKDLRFIFILDPAINVEKENYATHDRAMQKGVYITWHNDTLQPDADCTTSPGNCQELDNVMLGYVWPDGKTAFPDFFKPATQEWWKEELRILYNDLLKYDGIWIDMNEPAAFDTNKDKPFNWPENRPPWNLRCPFNEWDDPPYNTLAAERSDTKRLSDKTICMVGRQGGNSEHLHYAVHNLYGWSQTEPTFSGVQAATGKRGIVITRSTYPSSGKYAGHWLGDNTSRWKDLHTSIIGMLEFNMFGIPYIGADICGFFLNTTETLCQRWMELGAFYPFSRNHNTLGANPQDPAQWSSVADASKKALNVRYRLLPYLYTLFFHSHQTGSTVVRPLYHEYPKDVMAKSVDTQFLWGPALLISPVLTEGQTSLEAYLPNDMWYDYYTGKKETNVGTKVTWDTPLDKINLHVRGGYILPQQKEALNTAQSRKNNFSLLVANGNDKASGDLFWDDGETIDFTNKYTHISFNYTKNNNQFTLQAKREVISTSNPDELEGLKMEEITIYGMEIKPSSLSAGTQEYNESDEVLKIQGLSFAMNSDWQLTINV